MKAFEILRNHVMSTVCAHGRRFREILVGVTKHEEIYMPRASVEAGYVYSSCVFSRSIATKTLSAIFRGIVVTNVCPAFTSAVSQRWRPSVARLNCLHSFLRKGISNKFLLRYIVPS